MAEKKITKKKSVANKPVVKKSKVTLDNFPIEDLLKICKKDNVVVDKIQQLIGDYSFEEDQVERVRCMTIAYGNWAMVNYDANKDGKVDEFELDSNKHADKIFKAMDKIINA